jgi:hypothetical protein
MTTLDPHADRTALRLKLYENGFEPLANKSKACFIPGWSTIDITPEVIQSGLWVGPPRSRRVPFPDTGVRCGDVIAMDWDIDDKDLLNDLLDAVIEQGLITESPFVRIGRPPRELWVYRTSDKIGKRTTGHFMPPNAEPDHKGFAVEVLGHGCQFAAYGQRDENTAYSWPVQSLVDHEYMDLPVITKVQAEAVIEFASLFFELHGLERKSRAGGTDEGYTHAFDLTDDMAFEVHDIGVMTVAEMADYFAVNPDDVLRCKVDTFRPTSGSWAGMVSFVNSHVCISDHGTYTSHFPAAADDSKALERLGALLAERFPEPIVKSNDDLPVDLTPLDPLQPLDVNLQRALNRYVLIHEDATITDLTDLTVKWKTAQFRTMMEPYHEEKAGPKGGRELVWLSDLWSRNPHRREVRSIAMRPDMPYPLYRENGLLHLNTYKPRTFPAGGNPNIGLQFLEHLLPVDAERHYFMQWLAHKIQHPEVRGTGIIMVAHQTFGTGRGSLIQLLRLIFPEGTVRNIDFDMLSGRNYQSQYNDWRVDSLIVAVDEAQESTQNVSRWQTRSNAYERLKEVVDPSTTDLTVVRKGAANTAGKTYASVVVMTNHMDSVVLPHNDRRFAIFENGASQPDEYWSAFHAWKNDQANIGAFVREVLKTDISSFKPYAPPPMTAAKADMVDAGSSALDRVFAEVMAKYANTVLVKEQVVLAMEDFLADATDDVPDDWQKIVDRMFLRATRKITTTNDRLRVDGRIRTVRAVGRPAPSVVSGPETLLEELAKHGPAVRQMKPSGKVVNFPNRN